MPTAVKWGWVLLIGFLSSCCLYGLFFWGMSRVSATSGAIADGANPILASLMAHFLLHDDKLTRRKLWALGLAFAGLCVIALVRHP
ncbi:MAG: DMT family transporter [Candidatus Sumerlaeota bacterium]|nr:DMT family transporter [Candidatus Sumerlaeota bacterium]